ncbi:MULTISPECIES: sigma-70 family RNA polymerase sigma factor [Bacteroides]|uniref:sigma-70 family RNA polymerase sigma factor n=1 Tax=Bacteroides TaxID=816 RepID=UPI000B38ED80|nr:MULTISPECIES: sigma-70 family RNA polymerase sigma factor [Bacteroides]MBM6946880.1 sigma-70 family RNA polymerase sigma factor [Bacteroides gallinaceum]OUO48278.1 RNA polymerase subunit sigma-70 [Bacteroides sp. An279]
MENRIKLSDRLITEYYEEYRQSVFFYICRRIENRSDAEDLTQDAFLRLLEYRMMIRRDTLKYFLFTIVRNLLNDYLRRYYKRQEIDRYLYDTLPVTTVEPESRIVADELRRLESRRVSALPEQRRKVYIMSRFQDKSAEDIAEELKLSRRTVENHLFISRKEVREFIRQCI